MLYLYLHCITLHCSYNCTYTIYTIATYNTYNTIHVTKINLLTHLRSSLPYCVQCKYVSQFCHIENIVSAVKQKHILLLETMFPKWQNWETSRGHVSIANVSRYINVSSFCQGFKVLNKFKLKVSSKPVPS